MLTCYDVAKYFILQTHRDSEDGITNLKLQKLLYYAQGYHLAMFGQPLFEDDLEAWDHGPVVADVYHTYKKWGGSNIPSSDCLNISGFNEAILGLLETIHKLYGQFTAWKLREMTHEEPPWKDNYERGVNNKPIPKEDLKNFFQTKVEEILPDLGTGYLATNYSTVVVQKLNFGQRLRPKGYLTELAQKAVESSRARHNEDPSLWASRLAKSLSSFDD